MKVKSMNQANIYIMKRLVVCQRCTRSFYPVLAETSCLWPELQEILPGAELTSHHIYIIEAKDNGGDISTGTVYTH